MNNNKKNIVLFFIKMMLIFIITDAILTLLISVIGSSILYSKYGINLLAQIIFALLVLIVMLIFKNSYVFTEKKEKFFKSVFLGIPILVITAINLCGNLLTIEGVSLGNLINLILLTLFIGIAEEFLCRGWIQNEFMERFSDSKKHIILSIVLSSLIFGLMHITNIFSGQTIYETIIQIAQATAAGVLFGSIYYKTKNIWAVIFLHSMYDFAIMLGDISLLKDCTINAPSTLGVVLYDSFISILIIILYILGAILVLRKVDRTKEHKADKKLILAILLIIMVIMLPFQVFIDGYDEYSTCYTFEKKTIKNTNYTEHYPNYENYIININEEVIGVEAEIPYEKTYNIKVYMNDNGKVAIRNLKTKYEIELEYQDVVEFEVIENDDVFAILIHTYDTESKIYYSEYINRNTISNSNSYIDNIKNSFKFYPVPDLNKVGYITFKDDEYKYPLFESDIYDKYIIDEHTNLFILEWE